ncbi:ADP-ribosyl cyclase/cyclic ADP-ribose hydrolase 1-like isoform X2 [Genypterus blacodes]|uniref:ADP-ribosyl cyclase/cyclic ADP-ribose hydrolase 1-like isoform X2 n=1 Tax=Genypterus blacodes TaxID=154954 RepID=UPI003F75B255
MEQRERSGSKKRRRSRCLLVGAGVAVLIFIIVVVAVAVSLQDKTDFKTTFVRRCEEFTSKELDCETAWTAFEKAYVGKDPCEVPMGAYDPLIAATPFKPSCNRMMFWSKTKDVVHDFTAKKDCFVTLEDTLLGSVLDGLTWCGKEGSTETFTTGCPGWTQCEHNPVRSFWNRISAGFADAACGDVTAMLNGSITTPFHPASIFGSIEVKRFNSTKMRTLNVVLVTDDTSPVANCSNPSLKDLQKELDKGIKYFCKEVTDSKIEACGSDPQKPCGSCW